MRNNNNDYLGLILKMSFVYLPAISDNQIVRIKEAISKNKPFFITLDEYLSVCVIEHKEATDNLKKLLARRCNFKKMLFCNMGKIRKVTPFNFESIWKIITPRKPIERDKKPICQYYKSDIFMDAMPEKVLHKPAKKGFERAIKAHQSMENLSAIITIKKCAIYEV